MSWDELTQFVRREAPSFLTSVRGVAAKDIATVERQYRVRLPDVYRHFLLLMGADSGDFHLFGPTSGHRFADVVARIPEDAAPVQQFFKIAYADDESMVSPPDHYLDLRRTDGVDAPVVRAEGGEDFNAADVEPSGFTFLEYVYRRLFGHLANARLPERALVTIPVHQHPMTLTELVSLFEQMKFAAALQPLPRVAGLRREGAWALVDLDASDQDFAVSLWGRDRATIEAVADQLVTRFPGAVVANRPRPSPPESRS
jgi:hypothetical protein